MKRRLHLLANLAVVAIATLFASCSAGNAPVGKRIDALDASAWKYSTWISAVDAPTTTDYNNGRAADGASWFVSTIRNEKPIASAKLMATSLGVFEVYVNGKPVGEEFLKPGFTHPLKTRRSFTYDITEAYVTKDKADSSFFLFN